MKLVFFAMLCSLLLSCNQNKKKEKEKEQTETKPAMNKNNFAKADSIIGIHEDRPLPDAITSKIIVTAGEIIVIVKGAKKLTKTYPFTQEEFNKLISSFKDLHIKGNAEKKCEGTGSDFLIFFRDTYKFATAADLKCDEGSINYNGANISLTYLIPDYYALAQEAQTSAYYNEADAKDSRWSVADKNKFMKECMEMDEGTAEVGPDTQRFCSCLLNKVEKAFRSQKEAYESDSKEFARWQDECMKTIIH